MKKIFISFSTPKFEYQKKMFNCVKELIIEKGFVPVTVENIDQNIIHPIFPIINRIKACSCFICLAFKKFQKGDYCYTSNWLDIEYSLALSLNIPCLVFIEDDIIPILLINSVSLPKPIVMPNSHNNLFWNDKNNIKNFVKKKTLNFF